MPHYLKVAEIDELPPGQGKTIHIAGRDVTVVNREGRYVATSTWARQGPGATHITETACAEQPGRRFPIGIGEADRVELTTGELSYQVKVEDQGVFVLVEEGHVHPGEEPKEAPKRKRRPTRGRR